MKKRKISEIEEMKRKAEEDVVKENKIYKTLIEKLSIDSIILSENLKIKDLFLSLKEDEMNKIFFEFKSKYCIFE